MTVVHREKTMEPTITHIGFTQIQLPVLNNSQFIWNSIKKKQCLAASCVPLPSKIVGTCAIIYCSVGLQKSLSLCGSDRCDYRAIWIAWMPDCDPKQLVPVPIGPLI